MVNAGRVLVLLVAGSCGCSCGEGSDQSGDDDDGEIRHVEYVGPTALTIPFFPFPQPQMDGKTGEYILGLGGAVRVYAIPPGSTVELYGSFVGQGPGPCTFEGGVCAGIQEPFLVATGVADPSLCTEDELTAGECASFTLATDLFTEPGSIAWQALVYPPDVAGVPGFTDCLVRHIGVGPADSHLEMVDVSAQAGFANIATSGNTHTGGIAFVDVNNDYWPDMFVANGATLDNKLFLNNGNGSFTNVSDRVHKPPGQIEAAGVSFADVDNDGDLDLVVPVDNPKQMQSFLAQPYEGGPNLFYLNEGDGTFRDDSEESGVIDPRGWRTSSSAFADYDLDGCIDLYLTNWAMAALPAGDNFDRLLRGNCDGTFDDVTAETGVDGKGRDGLVGFWWDADFDNYPELFVGNDSDQLDLPDFDPRGVFYKNTNGVLNEWVGLPSSVGGDTWAAMGVDIGDIDGDMDWDVYVTDVWYLMPVPQGNALYLGEDGGRTLSENKCVEHGLCFGYNSWPANFTDFDNDGWVDLWVGASFAADPDILYINRADGTGMFVPHRQLPFTDHFARAGTVADFDGDGAMDIFLWDEGDRGFLYRNASGLPRHWIELRLLGVQSNAAAIGARVELTTGNGRTQMRRVSGADSAHSQQDLVVHFGLGTALTATQIDIFWPSGQVQTLTAVPGDRFWLVREGAGLVEHAFLSGNAVWDADLGELTVTATTNYGGRADIDVTGLGPLQWNALLDTYVGTFPLAVPPADVELTSGFGGDPLLVAVP
jgi:hypothetical protein